MSVYGSLMGDMENDPIFGWVWNPSADNAHKLFPRFLNNGSDGHAVFLEITDFDQSNVRRLTPSFIAISM